MSTPAGVTRPCTPHQLLLPGKGVDDSVGLVPKTLAAPTDVVLTAASDDAGTAAFAGCSGAAAGCLGCATWGTALLALELAAGTKDFTRDQARPASDFTAGAALSMKYGSPAGLGEALAAGDLLAAAGPCRHMHGNSMDLRVRGQNGHNMCTVVCVLLHDKHC